MRHLAIARQSPTSRLSALILATLCLATSPTNAAPQPPPRGDREQIGSFDQDRVEAFALFFAEESYRKLGGPLLTLGRLLLGGRSKKEMIERLHRDPPRADERGVVFPFGSSNPLSFHFDAANGTMTVQVRMSRKDGEVGLWGLTAPEAAAALNAASSRRKRGGSDYAWDPVLDTLALRLVYREPPSDRSRFYQKVDGLVAARRRWSEGLFLDHMRRIVDERRGPASATGHAEGFRATLVLRHFSVGPDDTARWVGRYGRTWSEPASPPNVPRLVSDREMRPEQATHAFVHFEGATPDSEGRARIVAAFRVLGPVGRLRLEDPEVVVFDGITPPAGTVQLGDRGTTFALGADEPVGVHRVEVDVCDRVAGQCVALAHPITLVED